MVHITYIHVHIKHKSFADYVRIHKIKFYLKKVTKNKHKNITHFFMASLFLSYSLLKSMFSLFFLSIFKLFYILGLQMSYEAQIYSKMISQISSRLYFHLDPLPGPLCPCTESICLLARDGRWQQQEPLLQPPPLTGVKKYRINCRVRIYSNFILIVCLVQQYSMVTHNIFRVS